MLPHGGPPRSRADRGAAGHVGARARLRSGCRTGSQRSRGVQQTPSMQKRLPHSGRRRRSRRALSRRRSSRRRAVASAVEAAARAVRVRRAARAAGVVGVADVRAAGRRGGLVARAGARAERSRLDHRTAARCRQAARHAGRGKLAAARAVARAGVAARRSRSALSRGRGGAGGDVGAHPDAAGEVARLARAAARAAAADAVDAVAADALVGDVHATPFGFSAQLRLGAVPWQVNGATQSPSAVQVVLQAAPPQTYGEQLDVVAGAHVPVPLQCETGVKVEPVQTAFRTTRWRRPAGRRRRRCRRRCCRTAGWPDSARAVRPSPSGTCAQLPALCPRCRPGTARTTWLLQQTPSTQVLPVKHWSVAVQAWPRRCLLPQRLVCRSQMLRRQAVAVARARRLARRRAVADIGRARDGGRRQAGPAAVAGPARASASTDWPDTKAPRTTCRRRSAGKRRCRRRQTVGAAARGPCRRRRVSRVAGRHVACRSPRDAAARRILQTPVQLVWQQTPCAQKPVRHSWVAEAGRARRLEATRAVDASAGAGSRRRACRR